MDSQFDDLMGLDPKSQREEKIPGFFSKLHKVPKQIVDTCVSIGGNLKLIESGMPAPVLLPTQISHDRILSINDAAMDAFIISALIALAVLVGTSSTFFLIILALSTLYWGFHIAWWEEARQWKSIPMVDNYISKTYHLYTWLFILFFIVFSSYGHYYIINNKQSINETFISIKEHKVYKFIEKGIDEIETSGVVKKESIYDAIRQDKIKTKNTEGKDELIQDAYQQSLIPNKEEYLKQLAIVLLSFLIYTFAIRTHYKKKYQEMNEYMKKESSKELNSDIKNIQDDLREALDSNL